jgi:hypothetical protein
MKYLNSREEFLKKSISKINTFNELENISEADNSGPFANDIPWNDSLLGRLINSTVRKAKIMVNRPKMKSLLKSLRGALDKMIITEVNSSLNEEDYKEIKEMEVQEQINALDDAINNGESEDEIRRRAEELEKSDLKDREELIANLENLIKSLSNDESDEDKSLYPTMIKNLKSLSLVLSLYKNVKIELINKNIDKEKIVYVTKQGDTIYKIQKDTNINTKNLSIDNIRQKNNLLKEFPEDNQMLKAGLKLVLEGLQGNQPGGSVERGNIQNNEDHLTQSFNKLKKDIEILISPKEKGIGIDSNFINDIVNNSKRSENINYIKSLYVEIKKYLTGDKSNTIQDKDKLYKESFDLVKDKYKKIIIAEKIARFTKRALLFDKEGLYGGLGDLNKPLKDFVDTMKIIIDKKIKIEKKKEDELVGENLITSYNYFRTNESIKDWGNVFKKKEINKETSEVKRKVDEIQKSNKAIIINGMDPVLDVVKCFNKAYKVHTTQVIPTGRAGGRVSNKTFREYTTFGDGTPDSAGFRGGPYRNNKLFDIWERGVLSILADKDYQRIFNEDTKIKVGDQLIPKAGANLRKFITDMIDGDKLYKTGRDGQGLQAKFLDEYFNYKGDGRFFSEKDRKDVEETANKIEITEGSFTKKSVRFDKNEDLIGTFFLNYDGNKNLYYFYIQDIVGNDVYISYSSTLYFFKKYIKGSIDLKKGELPIALNTGLNNNKGKEFKIKGFKMKLDNLLDRDGSFKLSGSRHIKYMDKYDDGKNDPKLKSDIKSMDEERIEFNELYTLIDNNSNRLKSKKDINSVIDMVGGFNDISKDPNINNTYIK